MKLRLIDTPNELEIEEKSAECLSYSNEKKTVLYFLNSFEVRVELLTIISNHITNNDHNYLWLWHNRIDENQSIQQICVNLNDYDGFVHWNCIKYFTLWELFFILKSTKKLEEFLRYNVKDHNSTTFLWKFNRYATYWTFITSHNITK